VWPALRVAKSGSYDAEFTQKAGIPAQPTVFRILGEYGMFKASTVARYQPEDTS